MSRLASFVRRSCGALLLVLPLLAAPFAQATEATPATWSVTKPNGHTVTFLGSIHVLKPDMTWRTPGIMAAFDAAEVIVLEADVGQAQSPEVQALVMQLGFYPAGTTLRSKLSEADAKALEESAATLGVPIASLDQMRPWMAGVTLAVLMVQKQGFVPGSGVDFQVAAAAQMLGKEMAYLETVEGQLRAFADLPEDVQLKMLSSSSDDVIERPDMLQQLIDLWAKGDADGVGALMNESLSIIPEIKVALLDKRNAAWVTQIEGWMADDKDYFVVVGAGHLSGDGSVIALLRQAGVEVLGP